MLPEFKNFHRKIKIPKEISDQVDNPDTYWVVTWLGHSYWKDDRIQREVIITNIDNVHYYFSGKERQFKVFVLEEQTFTIQLGTYFKYNGRFLKNPQYLENSKAIEKFENVVFNPKTDYQTNWVYKHLQNTYMPPYYSEDDRIYSGAPYYSTVHNGTTIIVPGHVILSYFYYLSTLTIYNIIYGVYFAGLQPISSFDENGIPIIKYDSEYLRYDEAKNIAKFMLIKEGFNSLAHIKSDFYVALEKCKPDNRKAYLASRIPHSDEVNLTLIGKKISANKFLAFSIEDFSLKSGEGIFKYDNFLLKDISDKSSLNEESEDKNPTTGQVDNFDENVDSTTNPTNHNLNPVNISVNDSRKRFYQSPNVKELEKESQLNHFQMTQVQINEIAEVSELIKEHSSKDKVSRVNFISQNTVDYIQVVFDAINILKSEGAETEYLMIERSDFENVSYPPVKIKQVGTLILASILINDYNYCLISTVGNYGRMGLVRHSVKGLRFLSDRDPILEICLIKMINEYQLNWSEIKTAQQLTNIFQGMGVVLVHSFNHKIIENDHNKSVKNLVERLKEHL